MAFHWTAVFAVLLAAELVGYAAAATYVVGDSFGWGIPADGGVTYVNYGSQNVFRVGDVLVFNYTTGTHDVAGVNKAGYDGCGSTSPIFLATVGPTNVTLNTAGANYYICTFSQHCSLGQKLAINVTASTTSPSPAPTPISTPTPAPPPTSPSITPSPTPIVIPPASTPSPAPGGGVTPPAPSLAPGSPPAPSPGTPPGTPPPTSTLPPPPTSELSPPPPPSSAPIRTSYAALSVVFASTIVGLIMM